MADLLADYLVELRYWADLSQRELSVLSGVPVPTLARIESGATADPRLSTVAKLVAAAGYRLLICDDDNEPLLLPPEELRHIRDRADRRLPAHLDAIPVDERFRPWWVPKRDYTFVRNRGRRDEIRAQWSPQWLRSRRPRPGTP